MNEKKYKFRKICRVAIISCLALGIASFVASYVLFFLHFELYGFLLDSIVFLALLGAFFIYFYYLVKEDKILLDYTVDVRKQIKDFYDRKITFNGHITEVKCLDELSTDLNECFKSYARYNISLNPEAYTYDASRYIKLKRIIAKDDFFRLLPIEVERNDSYRFACLYIKVCGGNNTLDTMEILHQRINDVFGDVLIGKFDDTSLLVLIYNVDSIPLLTLSINELLRSFHELVVHKDDDVSYVNYCRVGVSIYPSSSIQNMISDSLLAFKNLSNDQDVNYYIPDDMTLNNRFLRTDTNKSKTYGELLFSFEDQLANSKTYQDRVITVKNFLKTFANMYGFSCAGIVLYDKDNKIYKPGIEYKYNENVDGFNDLSARPNEELDEIYNLTLEDHSFYGTSSKDVPFRLKPLFKRMNIVSFFFFKAMFLSNKVGLLYFYSEKEKPAITFSEFSMIFTFAFFFRASFFSIIDNQERYFLASSMNSILERENKYLYCVDKNTYRLSYLSNNLMSAFPKAHIGDLCYKVLRSAHDKPCSHCPLLFGADVRVIESLGIDPYKVSVLSYLGINENESTIIIESSGDLEAISNSGSLMDPLFRIPNSDGFQNSFSKALKAGSPGYLVFFRLLHLNEILITTKKESLIGVLSILLKRLSKTGKNQYLYEYDLEDYTFAFVLKGFNMVKTIDFIEDAAASLCQGVVFDGKEIKLNFNFITIPYPTGIASTYELGKIITDSYKKLNGNGDNLLQVVGESTFRSSIRENYILDLFKEANKTGTIGYNVQPIMNKGGQVEGAETFVRLSDKLRGPIAPMEFVPIAANNHLMFDCEMSLFNTIGDLYTNHSQDIFKASGLKYIDINISSDSILNPKFLDTCKLIVKRYQFEKGFIRFEIRLDVLVKNLNLDDVKALKEELNKIGIELVIDNVNSEAILESIAKCGINKVKIDRSITKDVLSADYNDVTEYARISSYCFRNGFEVVAEGIESKEVLDACRAYETTSFQGYYFAKPMEGQRFIEFLNYGK